MNTDKVPAPRKTDMKRSHAGNRVNPGKRRFLGTKFQTKSRHFADVRKKKLLREYHRQQRREKKKRDGSVTEEAGKTVLLESEEEDLAASVGTSFFDETQTVSSSHKEKEQAKKTKDMSSKRRHGHKNAPGVSMLSKAHEAWQKEMAAHQKEHEEREAERQRKAKAFAASQQQRKTQFRKLSTKTRHGQPVMACQIEHLLSKLTR